MILPRNITEVEDLQGVRVVCRLDLNTPLDEHGEVAGDFRITKSLPTLQYLVEKGARVVVLAHIGRDGAQSLKPVADYLNRLLPIKFIPSLKLSEVMEEVALLEDGKVLMLENLRSDKREMTNDLAFAQELSTLGDIYVNDAFSVSHREHASIVGIPALIPGYIGFQFSDEIRNLSLAEDPKHPFLFVLGGAKCATKIPLIKQFLPKADHIFVGGIPANNFFAEMGLETGESIVEPGDFGVAELLGNEKIVLPQDVTVKTSGGSREKDINDVEKDEIIYDVGSKTLEELRELVNMSSFVLWNGPLGNYEEGFEKGTAELLNIIAESSADSIIGGGDTLTVALKFDMEDKFTFLSTGGGAMLEFLAKGTLLGIEAIKNTQ